MTQIIYCSDCSRAVGEQRFGTAPRTDTWLLLEFTGEWGSKALEESDLAPAIKNHLIAWQKAAPARKVTFIRKAVRRDSADGYRCFVALTHPESPALYAFTLSQYDDLLDLPLDRIEEERAAFEAQAAFALRRTPLVIVCTNGRRDVSCAKYGTPVYQALARESIDTWQTSHVGGHRFAANLVILPDGLFYGHLDADSVSEVIEAHARGEIHLHYWRGRCGYDAPAQAAEYYLRGALGIVEARGVRVVGFEPRGEDAWTARLQRADGALYAVDVRRALSEWYGLENSTDAASFEEKKKRFPQFHLEGWRPL